MFSQTTVPESRGEKRFPGSFRSTANILMVRKYISHDDDRLYVSPAFLLPFLINPSRLLNVCLRLTLGNWRNNELRTHRNRNLLYQSDRSFSFYLIAFPDRIVYKFFEPACARLDERPYKNEKHLEILRMLSLKISTISLFNSVLFLRRAIRGASDKERNSRING